MVLIGTKWQTTQFQSSILIHPTSPSLQCSHPSTLQVTWSLESGHLLDRSVTQTWACWRKQRVRKRWKIWRFWGRFWGLSLTGSSYRHELLESPTKASKSAVIDPGEYGSFPVSKCSCHLWSSKTFVLVTLYSIAHSNRRDRSRCFTPLLQSQCFPSLNSMTGTCPRHCLSGRVTCWEIWRGLVGSPPTSCSTQVKMQTVELQIREEESATSLHPPLHAG